MRENLGSLPRDARTGRRDRHLINLGRVAMALVATSRLMKLARSPVPAFTLRHLLVGYLIAFGAGAAVEALRCAHWL
jgi:hypothetical protein